MHYKKLVRGLVEHYLLAPSEAVPMERFLEVSLRSAIFNDAPLYDLSPKDLNISEEEFSDILLLAEKIYFGLTV